MIIRTLSDDAFIERVRKNHLQRKPVAVACIVFGALFLGGGVWAAEYFDKQAKETMARLTEGTDVEAAATNLSLTLGIKIGSALASSAIGGITVFFAGINLLLGARKDRLLLHYHEEITARKGSKT